MTWTTTNQVTHPDAEEGCVELIQADIIAGLTVGVMAVPQSVSFAAMAGLPAAYGLYTAFIPVFAYSIIGSSRHLVQTFPPLCKHSTAMQQLTGVYMLLFCL